MIITSSSPCRLSLFCGGTDLPSYVEKYGGISISLAINLRQYIILYIGDDKKRKVENTFPPSSTPDFLLDFLKEANMFENTRISSLSDAYLGSGLGTSAAAAVAMIGALVKAKNIELSPYQIVQEAWKHENIDMRWYGGKQDQISSVYGGGNLIEFKDNTQNGFTVSAFDKRTLEEISKAMVLFYVGERKDKRVQEGMRELSKEQIKNLHLMKEISLGAIPYVARGDYSNIGKLLDTFWKLKKKANPNTSNVHIDEIYNKAKDAGALGGKLCGAGSGGYMFFVVEPERRKDFLLKMSNNKLQEVDFSFSYDGLQARIL